MVQFDFQYFFLRVFNSRFDHLPNLSVRHFDSLPNDAILEIILDERQPRSCPIDQPREPQSFSLQCHIANSKSIANSGQNALSFPTDYATFTNHGKTLFYCLHGTRFIAFWGLRGKPTS